MSAARTNRDANSNDSGPPVTSVALPRAGTTTQQKSKKGQKPTRYRERAGLRLAGVSDKRVQTGLGQRGLEPLDPSVELGGGSGRILT